MKVGVYNVLLVDILNVDNYNGTNINFGEIMTDNTFLNILIYIIIAIILSFLFAYPVMLLWNWLMPVIIPGIVKLGFWQSWGLMILCNFLFKSHGK